MIDITLPMPPSANAIWRGTGARVVKSAPYKQWQIHAGMAIQIAKVKGEVKRIEGAYMLLLGLPRCMRGDIDNRHKAINDILQKMGIVENDSFCDCLLVAHSDIINKNSCRVVVGSRSRILNPDDLHQLVLEAGRT